MTDGQMSERVERRKMWLDYARELGQEDDFRALLDDVRREAVEQCKRSQGSGVPWSGEAADPSIAAIAVAMRCPGHPFALRPSEQIHPTSPGVCWICGGRTD